MAVVFETDRLVVRQWGERDGDLARALDTYSRWEVARWLGSTPRAWEGPADAEAFLERCRARSADPRYGVWAVERRDTGVVAGSVLLVPLPLPLPLPVGEGDGDGSGGGEVEVGWHFHPDSWGHGFATEAARGALAKGFGEGLREIHAVVYPGNEPSMAVCRRLGMTGLGRTSRWYGVELEAFRIGRPDGE
ncbi:GNAT family N-acetyltransferase [Kitasatospora sp. NPDC096147]|uniref:GNAT family N-acetyltransferase n=1 Tax=Kitasatospora sp. NPDC096147 TaxID=3364093 RepID=UPI003827BD95